MTSLTADLSAACAARATRNTLAAARYTYVVAFNSLATAHDAYKAINTHDAAHIALRDALSAALDAYFSALDALAAAYEDDLDAEYKSASAALSAALDACDSSFNKFNAAIARDTYEVNE